MQSTIIEPQEAASIITASISKLNKTTGKCRCFIFLLEQCHHSEKELSCVKDILQKAEERISDLVTQRQIVLNDKPSPSKIPPTTKEKQNFESHLATFIKEFNDFLEQFMGSLTTGANIDIAVKKNNEHLERLKSLTKRSLKDLSKIKPLHEKKYAELRENQVKYLIDTEEKQIKLAMILSQIYLNNGGGQAYDASGISPDERQLLCDTICPENSELGSIADEISPAILSASMLRDDLRDCKKSGGMENITENIEAADKTIEYLTMVQTQLKAGKMPSENTEDMKELFALHEQCKQDRKTRDLCREETNLLQEQQLDLEQKIEKYEAEAAGSIEIAQKIETLHKAEQLMAQKALKAQQEMERRILKNDTESGSCSSCKSCQLI